MLVEVLRYVTGCTGHGCGAAWASEAPGQTYATPSMAIEAALRLGWLVEGERALCVECRRKEQGE